MATSKLLSFVPGPRQARPHSLLDDRALKLGEYPHHLEHGLAGRGRGVEALLMQEQVDPERVQFRQERDEVLQASPEPIDTPGHHHVELPLTGGPAEGVELRRLSRPLEPLMPWSR